jgi:UDP-glucose 4-epimerase
MMSEDITLPADTDVVIHLGGLSSPQRSLDLALVKRMNVEATERLLKASNNVSLLLYPSSVVVYSPSAVMPYKETSELDYVSSHPYTWSKIRIEQMCMEGTMPCAVLRLANTYGPKQQWQGEPTLVPQLIAQALKEKHIAVLDGAPRRDWLYVGDLARVIVDIIRKEASGIYNVGTGKDVPVIDFAKEIGAQVGVPVTDEKKGTNRSRDISIDVSKLKKTIGWVPSTTIHEGLTQTIPWYKKEMR